MHMDFNLTIIALNQSGFLNFICRNLYTYINYVLHTHLPFNLYVHEYASK